MCATDSDRFRASHAFDEFSEGNRPLAELLIGDDGRLYGTSALGGAHDSGTLYSIEADGTDFHVLHHFELMTDGGGPRGALIQDVDGRIYGTTSEGGAYGAGTLFSIQSNGTGLMVIRHMNPTNDGAQPIGGLFKGDDGRLFGTAYKEGANGGGVIFAVSPDGTAFEVIRHFGAFPEGNHPRGELTQGSDGRLYGTTVFGGTNNAGTIYAIDTNGSGFTTLRNLHQANDGSKPVAGLIEGSDGRLYGTASYGGTNSGTLFAVQPDGSGFAVLGKFSLPYSGGGPECRLIQGSDGRLYGTTSRGGPNDRGTVFALESDGNGFTTLHGFSHYADGFGPLAGLARGMDGRLYGTTYEGGANNSGTIFAIEPDGTSFVVLRNLSLHSRGDTPKTGITKGRDGRIYGGTGKGGAGNAGTLFVMEADGTGLSTLHEFFKSLDGSSPCGGLLHGSDGRLYGTALAGGMNNYGTVFAMEADGSGFTTLRHLAFTADGGNPQGGVIEGLDGRLYGTTYEGGPKGAGTAFAINRDGTGFTVLRSMSLVEDGGLSSAGLLLGRDGRLYGMLERSALYGEAGALYAMESNGSGFSVLRRLVRESDGSSPRGGLMQGVDERLYGVANDGGAFGGGTVFAVSPDGTEFTVLKHLNRALDGAHPDAKLVQGGDGLVYGTTTVGGEFDGGTVFAVAPDGTSFEILHHLNPTTDGQHATKELVVGSDGWIHAAASQEGPEGGGTVFSLNLTPEINSPLTAAGIYGAAFTYSITATNSPTDFDALNLPVGLSVDSSNGVISGAPLQTGLFTVTLAASNIYDTGTAELSLTVSPASALISITDTVQEYDGSPKSVTVTTSPAGLATVVTYNGNSAPPTAVGSYDVVATIDDPSYYGSASATLTVLPAGQPKITQQPQDVTVSAGKNVTFTVGVSSPTPVSYQWRKDGATISGATSATLRMNKVKATDAGAYHVVVTNAVGTITSNSATLTVTAPPVITSQPVSATASPGDNVSFAVTASGAGPLGYQWRKGGTAIPGATFATLALTNVQSADAGNYDVVVSNAYGVVVSNTATLTVAVVGAPVITQQPQSQTVKAGRNVTFSVTVSSSSPVTYQWFKGGAQLSGTTAATLKLTKVTATDAGVYTVVVTNTSASVTSAPATLTIK